MANSSGIVDYIRERFADLEDPDEIKKAIFSVVTILVDKNKMGFATEGAKVGYIDDMRLTNGGTVEDVDRAISEVISDLPTATKIPTLRGKYARGLRVPIDNVTGQIFERLPMEKEHLITAISAEEATDGVKRSVAVLMTGIQQIEAAIETLTPYDKRVFVGICNLQLLNEGEPVRVTPIQLWRYIFQDQTAKPREDQLAQMGDSIAKMASIFIRLDAKSIYSVYPDLDPRKGRIKEEANFLEVVKWAKRLDGNGELFSYYEFGREMPIPYQFAMIIEQVKTLKPKEPSALDFHIRRTKDNTAIVQIISDRIDMLESMREKGKRIYPTYRKITFEKFYGEADFTTCKSERAKANKRTRIRNAVFKQLNALKVDGIIDSYEEQKNGVAIYVRGEV